MAKRAFDFVVAALALPVLAPLWLCLGLAIKLSSPGPVLYRAQRVGKDGVQFALLKFRTMVVGAQASGPPITVQGDNRVTKMGRFLRKSKLDELPQLFNVLRGDMSLVGPRPEDPQYVALYTAEQRGVLAVRPGITSPASLHYRNEEALLSGPQWEQNYVDRLLPHKLEIELDYISKRTFWTDLDVIVKSILPPTQVSDHAA